MRFDGHAAQTADAVELTSAGPGDAARVDDGEIGIVARGCREESE
jgi:hypothetical protein